MSFEFSSTELRFSHRTADSLRAVAFSTGFRWLFSASFLGTMCSEIRAFFLCFRKRLLASFNVASRLCAQAPLASMVILSASLGFSTKQLFTPLKSREEAKNYRELLTNREKNREQKSTGLASQLARDSQQTPQAIAQQTSADQMLSLMTSDARLRCHICDGRRTLH